MTLKCDIGVRIKQAYDKKDNDALKNIAEKDLPETLRRLEVFHKAFKNQWFAENKAFGFEVQDIRIGGLMERVKTAIERINDYINKNIEAIEELEEERLFFDGRSSAVNGKGMAVYNWDMMCTANVL